LTVLNSDSNYVLEISEKVKNLEGLWLDILIGTFRGGGQKYPISNKNVLSKWYLWVLKKALLFSILNGVNM